MKARTHRGNHDRILSEITRLEIINEAWRRTEGEVPRRSILLAAFAASNVGIQRS
jgi:hypothetical protein